MTIPISAAQTGGTTGTEQVTNPNATMGSDEFLQLLMAQMQNQDPMAPMNDDSSIQEMAQFSTVQEITNLAGEVSSQGYANEISQAVALIGHTVGYTNADGSTGSGVATSVSVDQASGTVAIQVGATSIGPGQIVSVS
jgi:flagellar basal-body rod modification protein FlgD